jgi:WD40 repeat protein
MNGHSGDIYAVRYHSEEAYVATGGYDRTVRLFHLERGIAVKTFPGHQASIAALRFNPVGNLLISGCVLLLCLAY